jgi:FixJ family two-component response regulator
MGERARPVVSVVDDDASLRRSLRNLLLSAGFRVDTFASAEEFLRSAEPESTGCLVLDLRMTGMSGLDLLRHLAAAGSRVPVVVLTARGDAETRRRSLQAGAVAFLAKPFAGDALLDAIRAACIDTGATPRLGLGEDETSADSRDGGDGHES